MGSDSMTRGKAGNSEELVAAPGRRERGRVALAVLVVILLLGAAVRLRLLDAPLDRDTGEYAYAGQLLLDGVPPYGQVNNMKMPGIYAAFAAVLGLFGETRSAIHLGLFFVNTATVQMLFFLARRFLDRFGVAAAVAGFALLSLGQQVRGTVSKAEHFVVLFAVAGLLLLVRALQSGSRRLLPLAGLMLGIAFLMKQHGAAFAAFGAAYLLWCEFDRRPRSVRRAIADLALLAGGILLPFLVTCGALWSAGVFERFWFWTVSYAWEYVSAEPLSTGLRRFGSYLSPIVGSAIAIWLLAGVGAAAAIGVAEFRKRAPFLLGLLVASLLATVPGLYFRPHYFIMLLPAVALLAGTGASLLDRTFSHRQSLLLKATPLAVVIAVLALGVHQQRQFFFEMTPEMATRTSYRGSPFIESVEIGRFIEANSEEGDRIAILGSEPQIYFYAKRRSATGYIYAYPLMEAHPYARQMQEEMIAEIEAARPRYLVVVRIPVSWLVRKKSDQMILNWVEQYAVENYRPVGIVEMASWNRAIYHWGSDAAGYVPRIPNSIVVFERIGGS